MSSTIPETKYAKSGDVHIAYQVVGDGPIDLVFMPTFASHVEFIWEEPAHARFLQRLASFSRLILLDKRGTGLSDRVTDAATLEERLDDVRAVLDAVGSQQAALLGASDGGSLAALFAATYPERTRALVLYAAVAAAAYNDEHPWAATPEQMAATIEVVERGWGSREFALAFLAMEAPSVAADERFQEWWMRFLRLAASPGAAVALTRMNMQIDITRVLPTIRVPTLVVQRTDDLIVPLEWSRYLAQQIPHAKLVELAGQDHLPAAGDAEALLGEIEEFLTGTRAAVETDRVLATVLFTDIVDSTKRAVALGDRRWRELLDSHDAGVRRELARARGREIKTTGDGFLAAFDGPARAIRCALAISAGARQLGLDVRAGLHTGECEVRGDDLRGSRSTSVRASPTMPARVRCSPRVPCEISSPALVCSSRIAVFTHSRACRASGGSTPSRRERTPSRSALLRR
jgi:pimeloyl-ACP methyl ester carboxylesterase